MGSTCGPTSLRTLAGCRKEKAHSSAQSRREREARSALRASPHMTLSARLEIEPGEQLDVRHAVSGRVQLEERAPTVSRADNEVEVAIEVGVAEIEPAWGVVFALHIVLDIGLE